MERTAVVATGPVTLRWRTVLQWELGATPSICADFASLDQIDRAVVDASVAIAVFLGASTEAMLGAAPVLRVGIALSSTKEGTTLPVRSVVAIAGEGLDRYWCRCRSWNRTGCRPTCFSDCRGRITVPATVAVCLAAGGEGRDMVALGSAPVWTTPSILPGLSCHKSRKGHKGSPAEPKHVAHDWQTGFPGVALQ